MATWTPDQSFYPSPRMAMKARARDAGLRRGLRSGPQGARRDRRRRRRSRARAAIRRSSAPSAMPNAGDELHHFGWNACSSCLCPNAPHPACRAALSRRAGPALLAHPHPRHQARSAQAEDRQGDRAGRGRRARRLHAAAHRPLRPGGHLCRGARQPRGQGAGRHLPHGPRELRRARPMGDGPRAAAARLRRLVASRPRHHGHQRMGHARHVRERARSRRCCSAPNTAGGCISGTCTSASTCRRSISATEYQLVFELRPAHDPTKAYGFVNCVISLKDLSSSIWTWYRDGDKWAVKKVIEIPAEPAERGRCCRRC